jgi:hypothetical protein
VNEVFRNSLAILLIFSLRRCGREGPVVAACVAMMALHPPPATASKCSKLSCGEPFAAVILYIFG